METNTCQRTLSNIQPVPETEGKQILPHQHFRPGVFAFDAAHVVASCFFIMYVGHGSFEFKVSGSKLGKKDGSPKREESRLRESIHQVNLESPGEGSAVELVALSPPAQ